MINVSKGENVKILTSEGEIDPNTYIVQYTKHGLVGLTCKETDITIKVNNQRIYKILTADELNPKKKIKRNQSKGKSPNKPPQKIDFDALVKQGFEVWTKKDLSLGSSPKVSNIKVEAHCVIDPEGSKNRGYEIFNSYNGTLGSKGKKGKRYTFNNKMTIEKKRNTLLKKGYVKHVIK